MTKKNHKDGKESVESARLGKPLQEGEQEKLLPYPLIVLRLKRGEVTVCSISPSPSTYNTFCIHSTEAEPNTPGVFRRSKDETLGHLILSEVRKLKRGFQLTIGSVVYQRAAKAMSWEEFKDLEKRRRDRVRRQEAKLTEVKHEGDETEQRPGAVEVPGEERIGVTESGDHLL